MPIGSPAAGPLLVPLCGGMLRGVEQRGTMLGASGGLRAVTFTGGSAGAVHLTRLLRQRLIRASMGIFYILVVEPRVLWQHGSCGDAIALTAPSRAP
jgi:hypothetical protein